MVALHKTDLIINSLHVALKCPDNYEYSDHDRKENDGRVPISARIPYR